MSRQTILAFILIGLIIIFYNDFINWFYPPPPPSPSDTTEQITREPAVERSSQPVIAENPTIPYDLPTLPVISTDSAVVDTIYPERIVTIETDRFLVKLSTNGAKLQSLKIKPKERYLEEEIELIPSTDDARPGFRFWTMDGPLDTERLSFRLADDDGTDDLSYNLAINDRREIEFVTELGNNRRLSIIYTFSGDGYTFLCKAQGTGTEDLWERDYVEFYWKGGLAYTETDTTQDVTYSKAFNYYAGDVLEDMKINKKRNETKGPNDGQTRWAAIRTKYFIIALIPEEYPAIAGWMESRLDSLYIGEHTPNRLGVGLKLPLEGSSPTTSVRIFAGPLDDTILKTVDPDLTETMSWGWVIFEPFSKAILWGLKHLVKIIPNYGICIIIFSVLIKIIIWPLTRKSYQSMSGMQRIQPQIKELNKKYKKDPQRKQKEMMKLYKEEGINPMGGCLPILLQMPLLIALFQVFRSTIEFRRAPFVAWINDLSMPDILFHLPFTVPMYGDHVALLPILMGISTFYQSKATMSDPNQKMMLYFMPIFMVVIFNNFPSGLTLYYTLFNVWTLIQQKITPPPKPGDQKPTKASKK